MQALHARLIFLAFLGLVGAIAFNATFLQKGPHPAPIATDAGKTSSIPRTSQRGVTVPKTVKKPDIVETSPPSNDVVKAVQRELSQRGYDPGPVDGRLRPMTRASIIAYQHDRSLPITGAPSPALLQHIVLGGSQGGARETAIPDETTALIKSVQKLLADHGYNPGSLDGMMGTGTQKAIETFEKERGLPVTGRISGRLLRELSRVTGAKLDQ